MLLSFSVLDKMHCEYEELEKTFAKRKSTIRNLIQQLNNLQNDINKTITIYNEEGFTVAIQNEVESTNTRLEEFEKNLLQRGKLLEELEKVHMVNLGISSFLCVFFFYIFYS